MNKNYELDKNKTNENKIVIEDLKIKISNEQNEFNNLNEKLSKKSQIMKKIQYIIIKKK